MLTAVLNTSATRTVRNDDLHESDYTPWEGQQVRAWPFMTIMRGKIMVEGGEFFGDPAHGQYLKRRIPQSIRDTAGR